LLRFESTITTPVKKRAIPRNKRTSIKPDIVVLLRGIYHHRLADMDRSVHDRALTTASPRSLRARGAETTFGDHRPAATTAKHQQILQVS
jgi:hypothetical protein